MYKLLFFFFGISLVMAQDVIPDSRQLSENEIDSIFSSEIKRKYDINFEVYRGYSYDDKEGGHILLMTEKPTPKKGDTFGKEHLNEYHDSIKAYFFDVSNAKLKLKRTLTDFIKTNEVSKEYSIAYWTKFFELGDYDDNGTIDPILIYGTYGMNGTGDGRIKIIVLQDNKKIVIRHQNGTLDYERNTQVDAEFYDLPRGIQKQVIKQMKAIIENDSAIFPSGWQEAMKAKKLKFDEL